MNIFSPTTLNQYIKSRLDSDPFLYNINLKGELSNYRGASGNGHCYFSIKDERSLIDCVMFNEYATYRDPNLKDGDEVIIEGSIGVYLARGKYQIYVKRLEIYGKGAQLIELEKLKAKLFAEGLFDSRHKKALPLYPTKIALISAKNSAALKDMTTNIFRRFPLAKVAIFDALTQGEEASKSLISALNDAIDANPSVIIIGRGGGSSEDLSPFNDEQLARVVYASPIPIISAVGHEINTTIIDLVADCRASTPTGAAELATPDIDDIYARLAFLKTHFNTKISEIYKRNENKLKLLSTRIRYDKPWEKILEKNLDRLAKYRLDINLLINARLNENAQRILIAKKRLNALSPYEVLNRGYSIVLTSEGNVVDSLDKIQEHDKLYTRLKDGIITSTVVGKKKIKN